MPNSKEYSDFFLFWFLDIGKSRGEYKQPILTATGVKLVKKVCDVFEQETAVFIMAVDVLEDYIRLKNRKGETVVDPILLTATAIFLCHKNEGATECLKVKHVQDVLYYFTQKTYTPIEITAMEVQIINELNGKLPVTTAVSDLDIIIEKYMSKTKLTTNVRPLCTKILEYMYIEKYLWFKELKATYSQNKDCEIVFQHLVTTRFYVPIGVFLTAIELSFLKHIIDINTILSDITRYTKIHEDHVRILVEKIIDLLNETST